MKNQKLWAIVDKKDKTVVYGSICDFPKHEEHFLAVFSKKSLAEMCKRNHAEFYKNCKIVPLLASPE